ncbi:hypothetical protein LSH36_824g01032 [Paralvinella palmiformis]|uniref:Mab-21-like nucleotidyltransferase domain-containing protein n=1 Tax=Paralvinella palmiformis TaxID=53620 RepID=A0AAD9J0E5_9ANNE|nr:hypothetical protein LSH36_824g01032 [Paralvinella palmiformis]
MSDRTRLKKLGVYLNRLDQSQRIGERSDRERVKTIQTGIECIVERLTARIGRAESMFTGKIEHMGSIYDGLKVGAPDEFDFMLVLDQFTHDNGLGRILLTSNPPGFAAISVNVKDAPSKWPVVDYCLEHEQLFVVDKVVVHYCSKGRRVKVLDPLIIQKEYRQIADKQMAVIDLPDKWSHGGFNKPHFSGHRKHGPATLFQFMYQDKEGEIKVTIDLTLAIRLRLGVDLAVTEMNLLRRFPLGNRYPEILLERLQTDPGMHVIPLYSKFLIEGGHAKKKYNWRVSCSCSEKIVFQSMPDTSLFKTAIRVLKILRDKHLTYYKRKTERKRKKLRRKATNKATGRSRSDSDEDEFLERFHASLSLSAADDDDDDYDVQQTTDLTEFEYMSDEQATARYRSTAPQYQARDIGFVSADPKPGTGEYWGARHYISSVEIKTLALHMLFGELPLKNLDGELIDYIGPADDEHLALMVMFGVNFFKKMFRERKQIMCLYFDTALCSPLPTDQIADALKAMDKIASELTENG